LSDTFCRDFARFVLEADFMAMNINAIQRPSDRKLFFAAAVLFPLFVLVGYFKSYYFSTFFNDARPIANSLVHLHGVVMTVWVLYFTAQVGLVRTKNIKMHITMGMFGIALAALVVVVGMATAYDSHIVRHTAPPGLDPYSFMMVPLVGMLLFIVFFAGAIYYRKRPAEHKSLMLLTALNFLPAALVRIPLIGENFGIFGAFALADLLAIICLIWHTRKHGKMNRVFALGVAILIVSHPFQIIAGASETWIQFVGWVFA
jgi:hypothetical protein